MIWYDEALKPLCAGIKHDKQRDKYISFITNAKAEIIESKVLSLMGIDTVKPLRKCLTMNF
nr:hypothetical protein [Campylobacter jejuni]